MGMYTELIFGASLNKDTPKEVIDILRFMVGEQEKPDVLPEHEFFHAERWTALFFQSSYYFGVSESLRKIWLDDISNSWIISTRSNIKNYDSEIEKFCDWIKPYISNGSGNNNFYAISCYEESEEPKIYYKHLE